MDLSKPGSARFLVQHHATAKFGEFVVQARPAPLPTECLAEASEVHGATELSGLFILCLPLGALPLGAYGTVKEASEFVMGARPACWVR